MASGLTPISGLPVPNSNDGFGISSDLRALATALDTKVVMAFGSIAERSTKAPTAQDGALCFLRDQRRYEIFSAADNAWVWPDWAQGQLARADYVETDNTPPRPGRTPLSNTPAGLPAFNVSVPNLPAGRNIKVTFSGMASCDTQCVYGFVLVFAGVQRRGGVDLRWGGDGPVNFNITYTFRTANSFQLATGGIQTGAVLTPGANCYLHASGFDGPTQFLVEDLGA